SGDTLQQALVQAANHYHLQPEEIAYHQIEKRHGFTKVRRKVVIEVDPAAPRREPGAAPPAEAAVRTAPPAPPASHNVPAGPPARSAAGSAERQPGAGAGPSLRRRPETQPASGSAGSAGLLMPEGNAAAPHSRRGGPGEHRGRPRRPSGA